MRMGNTAVAHLGDAQKENTKLSEKGENMKDDSYREMLEQEKIEAFDRILDLYQDDESYQKRASRIMDVVRNFLLRRSVL